MRTIVLCSLLSAILFNNCASKKVTNNDDVLKEENHPVRELYLSSIEALNEGNLDLFLTNFAPEIKMYGTDGNYFGQNALRERFQNVLQQFPDMRMEIPKLTLEMLSKDVVLVNFKWKVFPMNQGPAYSGIGSGIYTYRNNKWSEILEIETVTHIAKELQVRK
ncbi:YybH family protein [Maribacter sp. 4G9]|uniref:YybH family protein n=1 Tax=Maribacter sp. 4G9 TaxID=1889777 RepID=UPI0013FD4650|nr:nuclear transport factor 2 family protein [Maribacter sp. 4G9]